MNYQLIKEVIDLVEQYELTSKNGKEEKNSIEGFKRWIASNFQQQDQIVEIDWEGKEKGRSPESVISTLIVHMNRYAKSYSKSAIYGSEFSSQEDFIYLINLKAFGSMTKTDLIKKNVHEKPVGMQVINRLISKGWVNQVPSPLDKRSKVLEITEEGKIALEAQMDKIRKATQIVTGDLNRKEKLELIRLLTKLDAYHKTIYDQNIEPENLLKQVLKK